MKYTAFVGKFGSRERDASAYLSGGKNYEFTKGVDEPHHVCVLNRKLESISNIVNKDKRMPVFGLAYKFGNNSPNLCTTPKYPLNRQNSAHVDVPIGSEADEAVILNNNKAPMQWRSEPSENLKNVTAAWDTYLQVEIEDPITSTYDFATMPCRVGTNPNYKLGSSTIMKARKPLTMVVGANSPDDKPGKFSCDVTTNWNVIDGWTSTKYTDNVQYLNKFCPGDEEYCNDSIEYCRKVVARELVEDTANSGEIDNWSRCQNLLSTVCKDSTKLGNYPACKTYCRNLSDDTCNTPVAEYCNSIKSDPKHEDNKTFCSCIKSNLTTAYNEMYKSKPDDLKVMANWLAQPAPLKCWSSECLNGGYVMNKNARDTCNLCVQDNEINVVNSSINMTQIKQNNTCEVKSAVTNNNNTGSPATGTSTSTTNTTGSNSSATGSSTTGNNSLFIGISVFVVLILGCCCALVIIILAFMTSM